MIRWSDERDAAAIRAVHEAGFPTAAEADLVEALVAAGDATVSLVAEEDGAVVGHILLSRMRMEPEVPALGLAPVAVLPASQRRGIGAALVEQALEAARRQGEALIFLLGDPAYYGRFGFSAETAAGFTSPYAGPYFQALALVSMPRCEGRADYPPAFASL